MKRLSAILLVAAAVAVVSANVYFHFTKPAAPPPPPVQSMPPAVGPVQPAENIASNGPSSPAAPLAVPQPQAGASPDREQAVLSQDAKSALERNDFGRALDLCKRLAARDPKGHLCASQAAQRLGNEAAAIDHAEQALAALGGVREAHRYLALAYHNRRTYDKSLVHCEKALALGQDPELVALKERLQQVEQAHRNFIGENSRHFRIEYDGYEHGKVSRIVIGMLEDAYSTVGNDLNHFPSEPITVILYTSHDFHDITLTPGWVGGFFDKHDGKIRVPVRGVEGKEALLKRVLVHEYLHAFIHSVAKSAPLWLHEGLAEYYSKGPSQRVGQLIPLTQLEHSMAGLTGQGIMVAYAESHSAVSHLMDRYRPHRMRELLFALGRGSNMEDAFQGAFQMRYTEFVAKWGKK